MRRAAFLATGGLAALTIAAVVLWSALPWVLETWGARWIAGSLGIPTPRFIVADLSASRLEVRDLRIGTGGGEEIAAEAVVVTFDLAGRRLSSLTIDGARIEAAWRDGTVVVDGIGPLPRMAADGGEDAGGPPRLPVDHLRVAGARLLVRSPLGLIEAVLDATATQRGEMLTAEGNLSATGPGLAAEAAFSLHGPPDRAVPWLGMAGRAQLDLTARDATIPGLVEGIDGYAGFTVDAQPRGIRVSSAEGLVFTARHLDPAARAALPDPLAAEVEAGVTIVAGGLIDHPLTVVLARHGANSLRLSGSGEASALLGTVTARISGSGSAVVDGGGVTHLALGQADVVVNGFPALGGRIHASLLGRDIVGRPDALTLEAETYVLGENLAHAGMTTPRLRLRAAGPVTWQEGLVRVGLTSGHVAVDGPTHLPGADLPHGLDWQVMAPEADAVVADLTAETPVLRTHLAIPEPALAVTSGGLALEGRFASADVDVALPLGGEEPGRTVALVLRGGTVTAGPLGASAIDVTVREGPEGLAAEADAQVPLLPGEAAPLSAKAQAQRPVRLHVSASRAPGAPVVFSATARRGDLATLLTAEGRHDLDSGIGRASVRMPRLTFGDALQPGHLYAPLAAAAVRVEGDVAMQGQVKWTPAAVSPRLEVLLDGLTLHRGFVVLREMHGVVTLTQVWPPRTPPDQVLAVAAIDAGVPFADAEMTYHLDGKGKAVIGAARMKLAEGTIHADPFALPLDGDGARTVLHMTGVRLDPLVELADLGGLTATGTLSGEVPVELRQGNVLFHDGSLRSQEPGTIRYRPAQAPDALAGGGAGVDLMLQALDDFHYSALRLSLSGSAAGDLEVGLHVAGANPALYDGYPLEFNLTLSGALARIIEGSLAGYQVPDRIRRQLERFGVEP